MSTLHPTHRALLAGAALAFGLAGPALAQSAAAPAGEAPRALAEPAGQPPCTVAALHGSCAFSVRGFTDAASGLPPALLGAFAAAGTTVYDGAGKVTIAARSASFNGVARTLPAETGSYEVGSDCVVSARYPSGVSTRNVLIDGGREIVFVETDPGTTLLVRARRQD